MDKSNKVNSIVNLLNTNFCDFLKKHNDNYSDTLKINILKLHSDDTINMMHSDLTEAGTPNIKKKSPKQSKSSSSNIQKISPKPAKTTKNTIKYYHEIMIQHSRFENGYEFDLGFRNEHRIKILQELSVREDTLLYIGEVLRSTSINDRRVIVKIQPRYDKEILENIIGEKITLKANLHVPYQVATEKYIMEKLKKECPNALVSKIHLYTSLKIPNQLEKYVLISTELYRDLTILKGTHIDIIKKSTLLALNALKIFHKCGFLHMDIKHENMMFSTKKMDEVKLIDFGSTELVFDRNGNRKILEASNGVEGTPMYMSVGQHEKNIKDYMDDIQAFAWMLLDLLSDRLIMVGMYWSGSNYTEICMKKKDFIENAKHGFSNKEYNDLFIGGNITENNLKVIGELAMYTYKRADMSVNDKYYTDKYHPKYNYYYSEFNDKYYKDIEIIINKLK